MIQISTILAVVAGLGGLLLFFKRDRLLQTTTLLVAAFLLFFTSVAPALAQTQIAALGAQDETVSRDETDLKVNPGGGHYTGLEYAKQPKAGEAFLNDDDIQEKIESQVNDNVTVAVANGSVRLTGRVNSEKDARQLVEEVKEIPGVHEITFDLGLNQFATQVSN